MIIGPFELQEIISLLASLIAFMFIYKAYKEGITNSVAKRFWRYFLLIALFNLLSRLFGNIEAFAFMPYFNLLEHLSRLATAVIFLIIGRRTLKGDFIG